MGLLQTHSVFSARDQLIFDFHLKPFRSGSFVLAVGPDNA